MINKINKKISMILLTFEFIFVIIIIILKTFADDNLNTRTVHYTIGSTVNYAFDFFTDCIKFHTKASGYEKYKGMETENNMNSMIGTDTTKMQGFGNYVFKEDTNLFGFIDYCYSKEPAIVMASAYRAGTTELNTYDYTVLLSYKDRQVNNDYFKYFWQNMSNLCLNFKDYQDDFFFLKYTKPATEKIGINLAMIRNAYNDEESIKEYLTCLTSYIFSITPEAQVEGMTFGKGDVVPFLYYKDRKHADIDVRNDSEALMDIAKYAYVALIEGWCNLPTSYHLWENEYNFLFGNYDREDLDYDIEILHEWYDETYQKYCKDKGKKGNNLLGSDINHIIESDYSIEQQLEATEYYLRQVFNELGIESDFKETMARNELMAKYMMEHSNFDETIKDYNVAIKFMTENLQRGTNEEQNTHIVVTSDFQTLEFPYTMNRRFSEHSDEDTLSDGAELGNEKWINITEFVRRTYEDAKSKGESHKVTFEEQVEDIIEKNGAYTDFNGNKVYGSVKWDDTKTKVLYRVYDYKSNPKLNDTDFDGLWDSADNKPLDNKFKGTSTDIGKVEYNQDFRWFYTDNKKYNNEVAVMSLIMSNLADGNTVSTDQASGNIITYLNGIGFGSVQNIGEYGDNIYIAKKTIQYYDQKKDVVGLFLGKCDRWYSEVIKYKENQKAQVVNTVYRDSLESYIIRIINKLNLITTSDCSYWVAGYDVGGSIASELSTKLVDTGKVVYCYTFGAFNTRNSLDTKNEIKNIRNEDDFAVKFIAGTKPGQNYGASIYEDLMHQYRDFASNSNYEGNYMFTNFLLKVYDETEFLSINNENEAVRIITNYFMTFNKITNQNDIKNYADLSILLNKCADGNRQAHSIKSYYVLAKSLNGFDLLDGDGEKQEHYRTIPLSFIEAQKKKEDLKDDSSIIQALKDIAKWYVNNVFTYQGKKYYDSFIAADRVNGISNHQIYMLGTGIDNRIEFLQDNTANVPVYGGNYSLIGQKDGSDTEIKKKEGSVIKTYYFKRMTDNLLKFNYDWLCYIKASKNACKNNHQYVKKTGSILNYYIDCEPLSGFEYNDVGDDCVRFAFAVLEKGTGEEAKNLGNLGKDAGQFMTDDVTIANMSTYFDIYTGEDFINEFNKGLQDGDMLVSKNGDGISNTQKNTRNHCEFIYNSTLSPIWVFGWGNVKKKADSRARLSIRTNSSTNIKYVFNSEDGTYYSALYRKKVQ